MGCGVGTTAIRIARRFGASVTALDIAPSALGRARERADRAGARTITFVLDDATAPRLDVAHDLAVDRGLLHVLPRERWPAYAAGVARLLAPTGALIVVAHAPGADQGTTPVIGADLTALFPAFAVVRALPTTLAGAAAQQVELERRPP